MPKFTVYATITIHLETEIEADTYEEAYEYADNELISGDFEAVNQEFKLEAVREEK
jgi:hypothetical protein